MTVVKGASTLRKLTKTFRVRAGSATAFGNRTCHGVFESEAEDGERTSLDNVMRSNNVTLTLFSRMQKKSTVGRTHVADERDAASPDLSTNSKDQVSELHI